MARIRGLESTFSLAKDQIKSKQDCVVVALHCLLINEGLQCVGTGDEFPSEEVRSSELLPEQWNENQEVYTLRYVSEAANNRYLIKIVKAGNIMHIVIGLNEDKTAAMCANIDKLVSDDFDAYSSAYNDLEPFKNAFQKDIVKKLITKPSPASTSKPANKKSSPPRVEPSPVSRPHVPRIPPDFGNDSPFSGGHYPAFPNVGGSDLDPLGRGSGGMILDPSQFRGPRGGHMPPFGPSPDLPRGSVPPGARFDPFGPSIPGPNRSKPNPDLFRPPDFDDDDIL